MKHGKGTFTYPDGHQYVGEFKDDLVPLSPHDPLDQFDYELTSDSSFPLSDPISHSFFSVMAKAHIPTKIVV